MSKIAPCLWFDGEAEEAANFYVSLLPDSRVDTVQRNVIDSPGGKAGTVLVVEFTLAGQPFMAVNGGMRFEYTHAVSFKIDCADQAEVDRLWDGLLSGGGKAERCGWLKDKFGVSWQVFPVSVTTMLMDAEVEERVVAVGRRLAPKVLQVVARTLAFTEPRPVARS